jgi:Ku70/Ku80 beta-barrel domain
MEYIVAPRAYWKGYLKLSLVSCPVALFPASSEREKISFNQINKKTGNRIRYRKVDAETGDEVESSEIIKGYEVGKGQYIEIEPEELEAIAIESKRTIEIDEFVPKKESIYQQIWRCQRVSGPLHSGCAGLCSVGRRHPKNVTAPVLCGQYSVGTCLGTGARLSGRAACYGD